MGLRGIDFQDKTQMG